MTCSKRCCADMCVCIPRNSNISFGHVLFETEATAAELGSERSVTTLISTKRNRNSYASSVLRHQIRDTKSLSEIIVLGSTIAAIRFQDARCASDAHDGGPAPGGQGLHDPDHELAAGVQPSHLRPLRICTNPNSWRSITIWTLCHIPVA